MDTQQAVKQRYSHGARVREASLCCPVDYRAELLEALPGEIIEKDYGCGDPSRHVRTGDHVLDLGSGSGKICYMAAQLVGPEGRVIGIDMNDDMLALARKYLPEMRAKLGGVAIDFYKARIEDLAIDLAALEARLAELPVNDLQALEGMQAWLDAERRERPLIPDASVDLVLSNCVLNLVEDARKRQLISEIARVLKPGGRLAVSDIVCDRPVPERLKRDPQLWSGCISGAFEERAFVEAFAEAGLSGVRLDTWSDAPWQVVDGIEFRSVTVTACKPGGEAAGPAFQVIYRGPYCCVEPAVGVRYQRGERTAIDAQAWRELERIGCRDDFIRVGSSAGATRVEAACCAKTAGASPPAKEG